MHFENERKIMNSAAAVNNNAYHNNHNHNNNNNNSDNGNNKNSSISTTASCTSSTDSGVIIIDNNTRTINSDKYAAGDDNDDINNTSCKRNNSNSNHSHHHQEDNDYSTNAENFMSAQNDGDDRQRQPYTISQSQHGADTSVNDQLHLNIENIVNGGVGVVAAVSAMPGKTAAQSCERRRNKYSPTVSIRSTTISIVSIDENAIDSSVVDSDSELEADEEGVHSTYIVKKLGQQTTYAANSPDIPNIGNGLTVLSQTISAHADGAEPLTSSLMALGTSTSGGGGGPQIGSIALTNSSDVTFGDKHFYEGPVTIQQFLIDNREKSKANESAAADGQDNPLYAHKHTNGVHSKSGATAQPPGPQPYKYMFKRKTLLITGVCIVALILIGVIVVATTGLLKGAPAQSKLLGDGDDSRKNIPINSTIDRDNVGGGNILRIVARDAWLAQPPSSALVPLNSPVPRVIFMPTQTQDCTTQAQCTYRVRFIQTYNIESLQNDDIIYNFLIGGDGNVYEGRGWAYEGAHLRGFNDDSISFAYIGTFKAQKPTVKQLNVTRLLLQEGLRLGNLSKDYKIFSAHSLDPTLSATSGDALYESFKDWPHWQM